MYTCQGGGGECNVCMHVDVCKHVNLQLVIMLSLLVDFLHFSSFWRPKTRINI